MNGTRAPRIGAETFRKAFPMARSLWTAAPARIGDVANPMQLEAFWLGGTVVIVQDFGDGHGWNAFTPTTDNGRVDATLDAIAARCNVVRVELPTGEPSGVVAL